MFASETKEEKNEYDRLLAVQETGAGIGQNQRFTDKGNFQLAMIRNRAKIGQKENPGKLMIIFA